MSKSCHFPSFSLPGFHVIFHVICFFISENVTKNNWLQKFKNFSEKFYDGVLKVFRLQLCYKENSPQKYIDNLKAIYTV